MMHPQREEKQPLLSSSMEEGFGVPQPPPPSNGPTSNGVGGFARRASELLRLPQNVRRPSFQFQMPNMGTSEWSQRYSRLHPLIRYLLIMVLGFFILCLPFFVLSLMNRPGPLIYGVYFAAWSLLLALAYSSYFFSIILVYICKNVAVRLFTGNRPILIQFFLRSEKLMKWLFWLFFFLIIWDQFFTRNCNADTDRNGVNDTNGKFGAKEPSSFFEALLSLSAPSSVKRDLKNDENETNIGTRGANPSFMTNADGNNSPSKILFRQKVVNFLNQMWKVVNEPPGPQSCRLLYVRHIILCAISTVVGLLLVKLLVLYLAIKYQESIYRDRILKNRFDISVANQIYEYCRAEDRSANPTGASETGNAEQDLSHATSFPRLSPTPPISSSDAAASGGSWMSRFGRSFSFLRSSGSQDTSDVNGTRGVITSTTGSRRTPNGPWSYMPDYLMQRGRSNRVFSSDFTMLDPTDPSIRMTGVSDAKMRAKVIYNVLNSRSTDSSRSFLTPQDFDQVLNTASSTSEVFNVFDLDQDGRLGKAEMKQAMIGIYKENMNLSSSVNSSADALKALDTALCCILFILLMLIYLMIFGINVQSLLTLSLSIVIALNFLVGRSAKNVFDSMVLIFVNHPFDVGDHVVIQGIPDKVYTVHQINVLRSHFLDSCGAEVYFPNHILVGLSVMNLSRAHEQSEELELLLDISTTESQLNEFRNLLGTFLALNPHFYHRKYEMSASSLVTTSIDKLPLKLHIHCKQTMESTKKAERYRQLISAVKSALDRVGIMYYPKSSSGGRITPSSLETSSTSLRGSDVARTGAATNKLVSPVTSGTPKLDSTVSALLKPKASVPSPASIAKGMAKSTMTFPESSPALPETEDDASPHRSPE